MTLSVCSDPGPAAWLTEAGTRWDQLVSFGPQVFQAWARLRFIPDPVRPGQHEAGVDLPEDHVSDLDQGRAALDVLARFTTTPDDAYFCLWEGFSDVRLLRELPESSLVVLPHRRYALLRGASADLARWREVGATAQVPPAFVWPADRAWVFASDVDPHWAGVGGSTNAIEALLAAPGLDVVPADPTEPQPCYR